MKNITFKLKALIAFFVLCFGSPQLKAQCHMDDWTALKAIYESTDGYYWKIIPDG